MIIYFIFAGVGDIVPSIENPNVLNANILGTAKCYIAKKLQSENLFMQPLHHVMASQKHQHQKNIKTIFISLRYEQISWENCVFTGKVYMIFQ